MTGRASRNFARDVGIVDDPRALERVGEARALTMVGDALRAIGYAEDARRHAAATRRSDDPPVQRRRDDARATLALDLSGNAGVVWSPDGERLASVGAGYLVRQAACIGGGTTEMARNVISERLLGKPREPRADGGPFREVPRGPQLGGGGT